MTAPEVTTRALLVGTGLLAMFDFGVLSAMPTEGRAWVLIVATFCIGLYHLFIWTEGWEPPAVGGPWL